MDHAMNRTGIATPGEWPPTLFVRPEKLPGAKRHPGTDDDSGPASQAGNAAPLDDADADQYGPDPGQETVELFPDPDARLAPSRSPENGFGGLAVAELRQRDTASRSRRSDISRSSSAG